MLIGAIIGAVFMAALGAAVRRKPFIHMWVLSAGIGALIGLLIG